MFSSCSGRGGGGSRRWWRRRRWRRRRRSGRSCCVRERWQRDAANRVFDVADANGDAAFPDAADRCGAVGGCLDIIGGTRLDALEDVFQALAGIGLSPA